MIDELPTPPTLEQHKLVLHLRRLRESGSDVFDLSEAQAARAVAVSERAAVFVATTDTERMKLELLRLIRALVLDGKLSAAGSKLLLEILS